jgi:hypothetical protein
LHGQLSGKVGGHGSLPLDPFILEASPSDPTPHVTIRNVIQMYPTPKSHPSHAGRPENQSLTCSDTIPPTRFRQTIAFAVD